VPGALAFQAGTSCNDDRRSVAVNSGRVEITPQPTLDPACK
jgi:hypothetical protein